MCLLTLINFKSFKLILYSRFMALLACFMQSRLHCFYLFKFRFAIICCKQKMYIYNICLTDPCHSESLLTAMNLILCIELVIPTFPVCIVSGVPRFQTHFYHCFSSLPSRLQSWKSRAACQTVTMTIRSMTQRWMTQVCAGEGG